MILYTFVGVLLVLHNQFGNTLSSTTTEVYTTMESTTEEYTTMESTTEEYTTMESTTMESTSLPSTTTEPPTSTIGITQTTLETTTTDSPSTTTDSPSTTTTTDSPSTTTHITWTTTGISSTMASGTETTSVPLTATITVPDSTTSTSVSTTATTLSNEITTSSETTTSQTPPTSSDTTTTSGMTSDTTTTAGMTSETTTTTGMTSETTTVGMTSETTTTSGMTSDTTTTASITTISTPVGMTTTMGTSTDLSVTTSSVASENSQTTTTGDNQTTAAAPASTSEISSTTISITSSDNPTTTQMDSTTEGDNQTTAVTSSTATMSDVSSSSTPPDTTTDSVGVPSNVTVSPSVAVVLGMSSDNTRKEPHMVCVFADPGGGLFFLVKWYINNNLLTTTNYGAVTYDNVNTTAALRPNHWTSNYSMNMNVNCSVSAQYLVDSGQGPESRSPSFFAGVTINESTLSINEGETTQITLTSSVPVGCSASLTDAQKEAQCKANLHIITSEWSWCWNGVKYLSAAFPDNGCHVSIPYKYWGQAVILNVTGYVDAVKNWWGRYSSIKFKSTTNPSDASNAWNNMNIDHTVSVTVWDTSSYTSGGGICGGYNDPHMVTFDRRYWENQRVGEFVMYQHKTKPLAVHALYSTCYPWRAACNCGVAIRSGKNLYVVRTCIEVSLQRVNLLSYPYERYDGCSQEDEITVEKMGTNYRVTLPSGTEVSFSFSTYSHWINFIQIVASPTDLQNTEGICGYYDNNNTNDFVPKDTTAHTSDEKTFALSWRVEIGSTDSLFKKNPDVIYGSSSGGSTQQTTERYCTCSSFYNYNDQYNVPFDANYAKCNLEAPTEPCSDRSGQTVNVCSLSRRRRSTNSDDIMDEIEFSYDPEFNASAELQVADWPSGTWTEENATIFCNRSFTEDIAVTTCIEKVNTSAAEYIASCVEDIKMVGNSDFVQATLDTLKKECITTASRDSSFSNTTTDGGGSILDLLRSLVCPNNCSGQGVCVNETCDCNTNFIGEDCSVELSQPPANISIPQQGACDTSVRACQKTNIVGTFYSETIYAKCTYFKGTSTGKVSSSHEVLADVQYRHINLITVTIPSPPSSRRRRRSAGSDAHGWNVTLSYDNTTFGNAVVILLFDSTTTTCDTTTFICISKVAVAETESDNNAGIIAGAVVGCVVVIAVIVGIIIYITKYKKIKGRVSSSEVDLGNPKDSVPLTRPSL